MCMPVFSLVCVCRVSYQDFELGGGGGDTMVAGWCESTLTHTCVCVPIRGV